MMKTSNDIGERLNILEKAVSNLADTVDRRNAKTAEEIDDIFVELKAVKMFLAKAMPEFKERFLELQKKVESAGMRGKRC